MTPEERLTDIETKLQFTANMLQQMGLRHAGIRGLYRQGVNRMEELLDQQERQSMLLTALMESQMRTESQMRRTDEQMRRTDEQMRRTDEQMLRTDEQTRRTDEQMLRTDEQTRRTDEQTRRTDEQTRRTDEQMQRTDEQLRRTDEQMQSLARTFESYLASRQTDRPGA